MAPTYSRAQNRRQNRTGLVDHDIYEGLPVKQWRRDFVTVAPPPSQESTNSQNDIWAIELPWGMPKDSHMLPQHSQDLLRAARSGKIYKRPAPAEEEEVDPEVVLGDKPEKKDDDLKDKGFTAKAWKQIPRQSEASDVEYLAKRRKGLVTAAAKGTVPAPTLIKATVKRTDAVGNEYVQDVVVPQGQHVEGEVLSQTVIPALNPVAVQPTPPRRKGPVSKKKSKGPGRGRKKKQNAPTSVPTTEGIGGVAPSVEAADGAIGPDGVKIETDGNSTSHQNEDTEMGGDSNAASDNDEGDEGDEGDESEDEEGSDIHGSPSKATRPSSPAPSTLPTLHDIPDISQVDTEMSGTELSYPSNSPTDQEKSDERLGSPLKHIALTTSSLNSPIVSSAIPEISETEKTIKDIPALDQIMQEEVLESAPTDLPPVPPEPTIKEEIAAVRTLQEEEEEEEMLLDIIDNVNVPINEAPEVPASEVLPLEEPAPEVATSDILAPHVSAPEIPGLETLAPEISVPGVSTPEASAPEKPVPEIAVAEIPIAEIPVVEVETPQIHASEVLVLEVPTSEAVAPEIIAPETVVSQLTPPEPAAPEVEAAVLPESIPESNAAIKSPNEMEAIAAESDLSEPPESKPEDPPETGSAVQEESAPEESVKEESVKEVEPEAIKKPQVEEEEDDFPDLLGGLEASLS